MNCPWSTRPIRRKLYGPRTPALPAATSASQPSFIEIEFPTWAEKVCVFGPAGGSVGIPRWAPVPRAQLLPDGIISTTWPNNEFLFIFQTNAPMQDNFWVSVPCKTLTILNFDAVNFARVTVLAMLTDIPRDAMPELTADRGAWATYNGIGNDPT